MRVGVYDFPAPARAAGPIGEAALTAPAEPHFCRLRPWRRASGGWVVAILALVAGVPLFLCMPPWADVTLYDVAARNMLRGGVHYRDVFDTNLPGMPWLMALIRAALGRSYEVLRAVDLVVVGATVWVLCGWLRHCNCPGYAVAWFVAAAALFYPFQSEFTHVQRDVWMLLPAVGAARLRLRRVEDPTPQPPPCREGASEPSRAADVERPSMSFSPSLQGGGWGVGSWLEGALWGCAVWLKPHVVVPALAVWAVSAVLVARRESRRAVLTDLAGLILGGLLAGVPGVAWLVWSNAWPHFLDVFLNWNPSYLADAGPLGFRFNTVFNCFRPWSVIHAAALPLALVSLWRGRREREPHAAARALLAALYLGWMAQAVLMQKAFDYVHTPLTFLGMAVLAGRGWCCGFAYLVWFLAVGALVNAAEAYPAIKPAVKAFDPQSTYGRFEKHPLLDWDVMKLWPRCWTEGSSPELRDRLGQYTDIHCGTKWQELEAVACYLRTVGPPIRDEQLNCWHDSTHPLYLMLDIKPATRFMHYGTAFGIKAKRGEIADAVRASKQQYVVSDLLRATHDRTAVYRPESWRDGDPLPAWLPGAERERFPWNQPVVFRSGRYVVHKIDRSRPLGAVRVPDWDSLNRLHLPDAD